MKSEKKWDHDALAKDLANHLMANQDRVIWTDMQLGPSGSPRPDVYTINKAYSKFRPMAYEIKVSVSDFRSDVTKGKWQNYLRYACGVIFAVPSGLISKEDVPKGCGLIVRHENCWRLSKGPTLQALPDLPREFWLKLVIDGISRSERQIQRERAVNYHKVGQVIAHKFGEDLARLVKNLGTAEYELEDRIKRVRRKSGIVFDYQIAETQIESLKTEKMRIDDLRNDLCKLVGIENTESIWKIESGIRELKEKLLIDDRVQAVEMKLKKATSAAKKQLEELEALLLDRETNADR